MHLLDMLTLGFCRDGSELSTRDLQKMVQALPQYSEQIDKLSLHVEVSFCTSKNFIILENFLPMKNWWTILAAQLDKEVWYSPVFWYIDLLK